MPAQFVSLRCYDNTMLRQRLIFGSLMFAALGAVLHLDNLLDRFGRQAASVSDPLPWPGAGVPGLLMMVVFALLIALAARELCAVFRAKGVDSGTATIMLSALAGFFAMVAMDFGGDAPLHSAALASLLAFVFVAALIAHSFRRQRVDGAIASAAAALFSLVYLGLLPGFYLAIRSAHSAWVVAAIIVITKCADSGAYFTGRLIGRHRLIPWLSPGKTWEGLAGALVAAALCATLFAWLFNTCGGAGVWAQHDGSTHRLWVERPYRYGAVMFGGAVLGLAGHLGDLIASLLKRDAGIKDSGSTIPGFGGLLDVFDSPVVAAPVAYWLMVLAGRMD